MWGNLVKGFGIYKDGAYEQIILSGSNLFSLFCENMTFRSFLLN